MKLSRNGVLMIAALCLAPGAHAEQHGSASATVKAIVDYCARIDEDHRSEYVKFGDLVLASVGKTGSGGDYQATYDSVTVDLKQNSEKAGRASCAAGIGAKQSPHREDDRR